MPSLSELNDDIVRSMSIGAVFSDFGGKINSIDFHRTADLLVTASDDDSVRLYDIMSAKLLKTTYHTKHGADRICFTHHQSSVICSSRHNLDSGEILRYLSMYDNRCLRYFKGHKERVVSLCMSPVNDSFMSGSLDHSVRIWDVRVNACQGILHLRGRPTVAYDQQGLVFAVAMEGGAIKLFDSRSYDKGPFDTFLVGGDTAEDSVKQHSSSESSSLSLSFSQHSKSIPTMSMAMFSSTPPTHLTTLSPPHVKKTQLFYKPDFSLRPSKKLQYLVPIFASADEASGVAAAVTVEDEKPSESPVSAGETLGSNGSPPLAVAEAPEPATEETVVISNKFQDPKWVGGTWDLTQFAKDGKTDWDSVIDAEVKRRKWMEDNPQSSSNEDPIAFDTAIIPWWAWIKRFHLPEAELLNGRAAMIGFFMAYFVDSLTGVGLVDQMGNFFCKTLLFMAVVGVLLIRKNEDIGTLKKLLEETTFYDKQWQATWQDETSTKSDKN